MRKISTILFLAFLAITMLSGVLIAAINPNSSENGTLIVVNKMKNTVVIGYNVTLENTTITYKNLKIFIHDNAGKRSRKNLTSLIHSLTKMGAKSDDLITILTILHRAGTLRGKLVVI